MLHLIGQRPGPGRIRSSSAGSQTGNRPPAEVPAKLAYMLDDLKTWAAYYKVSFRFPESFPLNSLMPMRAAVFADRSGKGHEFALAVMQAYC